MARLPIEYSALSRLIWFLKSVLKSGLSQLGHAVFVLRAKVNVSAKSSPVNSVFLVQSRKFVSADFAGRRRIKRKVREQLRRRLIVRLFADVLREANNLIKLSAGLSTGLAQEMQKRSCA